MVAVTHRLKWRERARVLLIVQHQLGLMLRLRLQTLFEVGDGRAIKGVGSQDASLQSPAIEARTVGVETLADDLSTTDDDGTVAVVERGQLGLSEAERQEGIVSWRHFDLG